VSIARLFRSLVLAMTVPALALVAFGGCAGASKASGAAGASSGRSFGALVVTHTAVEYSPNWGGYVATGTKFRFVRATFAVPKLNCEKTPGDGKTPALVGEWVGLDEQTVEQDGISGECSHGHSEYAAWYETYPKAPVYPAVTVSAGDKIEASVWYVASKHEYELILSDLSSGAGFDKWEPCGANSCANSSAEVITESPGKTVAAKNGYFPLADCGTSSFSDISITDMIGQHGTFTSLDWQDTRFVMEDDSGRVKAAISGLADNGAAFQTYWEHAS
jgi:Peptidase A4 family